MSIENENPDAADSPPPHDIQAQSQIDFAGLMDEAIDAEEEIKKALAKKQRKVYPTFRVPHDEDFF